MRAEKMYSDVVLLEQSRFHIDFTNHDWEERTTLTYVYAEQTSLALESGKRLLFDISTL